ncbi:hypothetical protein HBI56_180770 [Parastagonospora nodorum]|nr:hypothetical protein HBH53_213940 [Parastagonospora nodorum]KAH3958280.1 hypothetical protein HBH51_212460 [Parastagonospora nodorum]KAH3962181.1 hypothetical protein HBH52_226710 [Parastagonospora nodorum]KAH3992063.1 hypothetical protein HBI10_222390 [Parastagonospora nodorum]KAH4009621.1 hypothetical protein HBI13_217070 [Parastagonospora nodorum]
MSWSSLETVVIHLLPLDRISLPGNVCSVHKDNVKFPGRILVETPEFCKGSNPVEVPYRAGIWLTRDSRPGQRLRSTCQSHLHYLERGVLWSSTCQHDPFRTEQRLD